MKLIGKKKNYHQKVQCNEFIILKIIFYANFHMAHYSRTFLNTFLIHVIDKKWTTTDEFYALDEIWMIVDDFHPLD
jgi:hypothetical protein